MEISKAKSMDLEAIKSLLKSHKLPIEDIQENEIVFYIIRENDEIKACAGIERYGEMGLLRSVAVQEKFRGKGLGNILVDRVVEETRKMGFTQLYLLTETARSFFEKKGFSLLERELAPDSIKNSSEFSEVCSSKATLLKKKL